MRRTHALLLIAGVCALSLGLSGVACRRDASRATTQPVPAPSVTPTPATSALLMSPKSEYSVLGALAFTRDGKRLYADGGGAGFFVWDVASGKQLASTVNGGYGGVRVFGELASGHDVVVLTGNALLALTSLDDGKQRWFLQPLDRPANITALALAPDGANGVVAKGDGTLGVWDIATHTSKRTFATRTRDIVTCAEYLGADGAELITAGSSSTPDGADARVRVWDVKSGTIVRTFEGPPENVAHLAVTPDGTRAVTVSLDASIRVWDVKSGKELQSFDLALQGEMPAVRGAGRGVRITRDGGRVLTAWPGSVCAWDVASRSRIACVSTRVDGLALSPDDRFVAYSAGTEIVVRSMETIGAGEDGGAPAPWVAWPRAPSTWSVERGASVPAPALASSATTAVADEARAVLALLSGDVSTKRLNEAADAPTPAPLPLPQTTIEGVMNPDAIPNAERVMASRRPLIRNCYVRARASNPDTAGKMTLAITVDASGAVTSVKATHSTGGLAQLAACVSAVFRRVSFDAPPKGQGTLHATFVFAPPPK